MDNAHKIKDITKQDVMLELQQLKKVDINKLPNNSRIGSKIIDYYTLNEKLKIRMQKCHYANFNEFFEREEIYANRHSSIKFFEYINQTLDWKDAKKVWKLFNFYYGYNSNFNALIAIKLFNEYKPKIVLDPFAAWGNRLLASYICKCKKYIGIESNLGLEKPYMQMKKLYGKMKIDLLFKDILTIDFSEMEYDFVFTKIPYYNQELHEYKQSFTENEINNNYEMIFKKIFESLKINGYICLQMANKLYKSVFHRVLGKAIQYKIFNRDRKNKRVEGLDEYDEIIYIWHKIGGFAPP